MGQDVDVLVVADLANAGANLTAQHQRVVDLYNQYNADRARNLSSILALSLFMTLVAQPIIGVISDRWRSKLGRRALWIIADAVAGALFIVGLRYSTNLALIAGFWVAGLLFGVIGLNAYFVFGIAVSIGAILFVLFASDRSSENLELPPFSRGGFFKGFISPLRHHDFRWVWLARFPFMFGYRASSMHTLFIPQSYIQPAMTEDQANTWFPIISIIGLLFMRISVAISGTWSDRVGKRKPIVIWSSGGVANVATNIGKPLAPVAWGQLVALTITWGSGYKAVHLMSAIFVFIGALGILKVRKVR